MGSHAWKNWDVSVETSQSENPMDDPMSHARKKMVCNAAKPLYYAHGYNIFNLYKKVKPNTFEQNHFKEDLTTRQHQK